MSGPNRATGWRLRGPELFGVLLIVIGVLYLLGNTNVIRFSWNAVWPIVLFGLGAIIFLNALRPTAASTGSLSIPRDGVEQLELELSLGAGSFVLAGGATGLVDVHSDQDNIDPRLDRSGTRARIRLRQHVRMVQFTGRTAAHWDIRLAEEVPTALSVNGGAGDFRFDLGRLRIVDAAMSIGAAQAVIVLPQPVGQLAIRISAGASSITIQVPPGVDARVIGNGGLLQVEGPQQTPGFAAATNRVTVTISGGATSIKVI